MGNQSSIDALGVRRILGRAEWSVPEPFGPAGWKLTHRNGTSTVLVSQAPFADGEYIHASIAHQDTMPTYASLRELHRAVFGDGYAYQVFAPPSQHVNIHPFALHLWGRVDGKPCMPEFGAGGTI